MFPDFSKLIHSLFANQNNWSSDFPILFNVSIEYHLKVPRKMNLSQALFNLTTHAT